jgi:hypothetical protein
MAVFISRLRGHTHRFLFAVLALAILNTAHAQPANDSTPEDQLTRLRYEWHQQHAKLEAASWEIDLIAPPRPGGPALGRFQDPTSLVNELRPVLVADYETFRNAARKLAETAQTRREDAKRDWEDVYKQKIAFRQFADQQQSAFGFDLDTGTLPGFSPDVFDGALLLCAIGVFLVARQIGRHTRRVALRRAKLMAASVLFACVLTPGCGKVTTRAPDGWQGREEATLKAEIEATRDNANTAIAAADKKWKATIESWVALVAVPGGTAESVDTIVRRDEAEVRKWLQTAAVESRLAERLAREAESEKTQLTADRAKVGSLISGAKWRSIAFASLRGVFAVVLFGIAITPFLRAQKRERALVQADAKKCPRCFSEKLHIEKTGTAPGAGDSETAEEDEEPVPRYRAGQRKAKAKPQATANAANETGYVECQSCGFRFLRSYQKVRRFCFPVVGVRNSGKTHMLATGYDKVRKRTAPTIATVIPAPSLGDDRFDLYIDLILNLKRDAGNTLHDVHNPPDPVMMHVRDADPQGANTALVNLFDYSGELVNQKIDVDRLKKQAVKMDGFMLFLDPTQLDGRSGGVTLDRQLAALNEFMSDMREARKIDPGDVIPVPVAIVIPKFDLLVTRNPIHGQSVPFIRKILGEMNPPPKQTTLQTLRDRSDLVEDMLELMFRGVDVRALVESYFGNQVMFFPVSSVSLFENELGIEDLSRRTIAPFGVAEPFLWLLHMHGYRVLGES